MQTKKECISCHKRKPLDHFYRTKANKVGAWCLVCENQQSLYQADDCWLWPSNTPNEVHRYQALTIELLKYLRAFEHKGCFICGRQNKGRRLVIDHDHKTNKVRGLLCNSCNVQLGKLRDNPPQDSPFFAYLTKALSMPLARIQPK